MNNIPEEPRYKPWREEALKRGYISSAAIPLVHEEKVYGALNVYSSQRDGFDDEETQLLVEVSSDIAFALRAIKLEEERKKAEEQLEHSFVDLAETVSRAMELRDPYTSGYQRRVAALACLVGEKMGLDKDRIQGLHVGGLLHDASKISIPESILSKPGRLTEEEWALARAHAKRGYDILKDTKLPWPVAEMALHHHERVDGSGYPDGISGDKLSLENRILGVCDVVEAMGSFRLYRLARGMAEVLKELRSGRETKYDADVVDIMLELIESGEFVFNGV